MKNITTQLQDLLLFEPHSLQLPSSWAGHLHFAFWLAKKYKPQTIVELGTHTGNSYFAFCQSVKNYGLGTKCYAVDTWQGDAHAGAYEEEVYNAVKSHNDSNYASFSKLMRMTFDDALEYFSDQSIDLLHIDGLHTYEAVKHDFEYWMPKLSKDAIVLFHDTQVYEPGFGVHKFWAEIKDQYSETFEFKHSNGLGVLCLGQSKMISELNDIKFLDLCSKLGERLIYRLELLQTQITLKEHLERLHDRELLIKETHQVIAARDEVVEHQEHVLDIRRKEIEDLNTHVASLERSKQQLDQILNSRTWRMTYPMRRVGRFARGKLVGLRVIIHALASGLKTSIKNPSYFIKAIRSAFRIFRTKGLGGLIQAIAKQNVEAAHYQNWVALYSSIDDTKRLEISKELLGTKNLPKISVIMPVYNPDQQLLTEAIESVKNQLYPNWQLCIVDDCSSDKKVGKYLSKMASEDPRIKCYINEQNSHICVTSNNGLQLSDGEWVTFLDHDDLLSEDALFHVWTAISSNPKAKLFYSDEDKISIDGDRSDPNFKPEWNLGLALSYNMITHLAVYEAETVKQLGGLRVGFEGAQDYDLSLRFSEKLDDNQIIHIPHILYHWRIHKGSTSFDNQVKPYALEAGQKALTEYCSRNNISADVKILDEFYKIEYALPKELPLVSIIIPTFNGYQILKTCIDSILEKSTYRNFEILIVDNQSNDVDTIDYLKKLESENNAKIISYPHPFNFSALNNEAVKSANGPILAFINNDIEVITETWLEEMVQLAIQPDAGAIGAKLYYPDDTVQHAGVVTGLGGVAGHSMKHAHRHDRGYMKRLIVRSDLSAVTAACLVVRKAVFEEVNGFNETALTVAFNDVDLCLKIAEAGYRNIWTPFAELYHHESKTRGFENTPSKQKRFTGEVEYMLATWGDRLKNDPAYNPNLTLDAENFGLAFPPRT